MGILPLQFKPGQNRYSLGLTGLGTFKIDVPSKLKPLQDINVKVQAKEGPAVEFTATCRIDTPVEIEYYRNGGILHTVLRNILKGK